MGDRIRLSSVPCRASEVLVLDRLNQPHRSTEVASGSIQGPPDFFPHSSVLSLCCVGFRFPRILGMTLEYLYIVVSGNCCSIHLSYGAKLKEGTSWVASPYQNGSIHPVSVWGTRQSGVLLGGVASPCEILYLCADEAAGSSTFVDSKRAGFAHKPSPGLAMKKTSSPSTVLYPWLSFSGLKCCSIAARSA